MKPDDLKLPEGELVTPVEIPEGTIVARLPAGFDRIWKILWAVDPAFLKQLDPINRQNIAKIAMDYQIKVDQSIAEMHAADAKAIQDVETHLKLR